MILAAEVYPFYKKGSRAALDREYTFFFKEYSLFSVATRSYKTCGRQEGIKLLETGKWFDKTVYTPLEIENQEELCHGIKENGNSENTCAVQLYERQEPKHQLDNADSLSDNGEELDVQAVWPRPSADKVRQRGRPKRS